MRNSSRRHYWLPVAALAALLAGCATPDASLLGADRAAVSSRLGAPAESHRLASGGERLFYPLGGLDQIAWAIDLDASGRVVQVEQTRTAERFGRVRVDRDTQADVRREFGRPYEIEHYSRMGLTAWMYPYIESGIWNSRMAIHFDAQGIVRRVENGPDPRFLKGGDGRR